MTIKFPVFVSTTFLALLFGTLNIVQSAPLLIDNEEVPLSAVDVFAKSIIKRTDYCPPVSDKFALDTFVRQLLLARKSETEEKEDRDERIQRAVKPHVEKLNKAKSSLDRQRDNKGVARVYKKQISRITTDIELIKDKHNQDFQSRTHFRVSSHNRLKQLDTASESDKQLVARMTGLVNLYAQQIRSDITGDVVQQYHEQLVQLKDKRIVDVHLFEHRSLYLTSNDTTTIDLAAEFLRKNANDASSSGLLMTGIPGVLVTPDNGRTHWSRLDSFDTVKTDPGALNAGSTIVEKANHPSFARVGEVYVLTYIYDKKYYQVVPLDIPIPYYHASPRTLRQEVYRNRMESIYKTLRAQSVVTMNGATVIEANDYAECPRR